jgi:hypothetical protein
MADVGSVPRLSLRVSCESRNRVPGPEGAVFTKSPGMLLILVMWALCQPEVGVWVALLV